MKLHITKLYIINPKLEYIEVMALPREFDCPDIVTYHNGEYTVKIMTEYSGKTGIERREYWK